MTEVQANLNDLAFRAESGDPNSQYSLGVLYLLGEALEQDLVAAYKWLEKAALQNHPESQILALKIAPSLFASPFPVQKNYNSAGRSLYDVVIRFLSHIPRHPRQFAPNFPVASLSKFRVRLKLRF